MEVSTEGTMKKTRDIKQLWDTCRDIQILLGLGLKMVCKYLAKYLPRCLKVRAGMTHVNIYMEKKNRILDRGA